MSIEFPTLAEHEIAIRLGLAALLGAAVGLEREWRERAAGLRTHMLVSIGAAALTIVSGYGWHDFYGHLDVSQTAAIPIRDPSRVAAQIVSGIGFLGGGVILRSGLNVRGLTTAASIWSVGAVGMAVGAGMYALATFTTVGILLSLIVLRYVSATMHGRFHPKATRVSMRLSSHESLNAVTAKVEEHTQEVTSFAVEAADIETSDQFVSMDVVLLPKVSKLDLGRLIAPMKGVVEVHVNEEDEG